METKKQIRKEILTKRDHLSQKERCEKSRRIMNKLFHLQDFQLAESVLFFASYGSEPDTDSLMGKCLEEGKKVYCPRVLGDEMEFYEIKSVEELKIGYKGIREPEAIESRRYHPMPGDFMIMPGVAFDRDRNRIGYGKGFYDRYLAGSFCGRKVAVCFGLQIVEKNRIPVQETDWKPDYILTEEEIITWN